MSTQQIPFTAFPVPDKKNQALEIANTVKRYLYHWPLFVIGLSIAAGLLFLHIKRTRPVYSVKATILIQDEKKTPNQASPLREIDLISSSKLIENEIEILKSKKLISQLIKDLKLDVVYKIKEGLVSRDLYGISPVKLTLLSPSGDYTNAGVSIKIKDDKSFYLVIDDENQKELSFKDTLQNSFGSWKLEPTKSVSQYSGDLININIADPEALALAYQNGIGISLSNKLSTALVLSIDDEVPQRGKDIINNLIYNYNLAGKTGKIQQTKNTLDFLDQRIASLAGELTQAEKGIEGYKSSRGMTDLSADSKISLENMQVSDARLNEVNVQLSVIESIERYINASKNSSEVPTTFGITEPGLSNLIEKLSELQLQRDRLLATTPETNPDFDPINRQIYTTKAAIKENVSNIKKSLLSTKSKLQSINSEFKSSIKSIPTQEREYVSIKRQQATKENLYTYLLQKREEASVSYATSLTDDHVIDQAYAGPAKNSQRMLAFAAALLLGLGLPAGLIYVRGMLSSKITTREDITDNLKTPIIVELPLEQGKNAIAINHTSQTVVSEQFRALRIKLYYLFGKKEYGRVTLVTSSVPGEGKSFVSSNLGRTLAYSGRKTIILELDMRKPKIAEIFGISKELPGISEYLNGHAEQSEIIQHAANEPGLHFITSGQLVANPSELLEKKLLVDLIESLKYIYDDIIIDSPPIHLVPDAMILSRVSDITLYMIRQGFTQKSELEFIKELDKQKQLTNINIIFNGIQRVKYGYGYDYDTNYYMQKKSAPLSFMFSDFLGRF
ncbi:polysaccharide biosynthesis tyrosine autokinase [Dyadobacter sp. CY107]|uniref:GumC family protein n=1 Tax=Dyadobacter fanqingshengii TaxID=2906443 RepID=UPI001F2F09E5|nr:tyrosine-protein kinase family protein [Dyadobacter fanqingshengii]MCF2504676.1 polysaccharide biosynthesis tyrosine autokinase [Dyadobacter fanqingshengii]